MKVTIGVYENHEKALAAAKELKDGGYPVKHLSIIGKAETEGVDEQGNPTEHYPLKLGGAAATTALGTTLGILTGVGLFAIPGIGFLYGAGALVGAIAGFDFGLIGGGIASVLMNTGVNEQAANKYHTELEGGKYLLVAQGSEDEVQKAKDILHAHGTHHILEMH